MPMASSEENQQGHHIVRADEVDQTGTDISPVPDEQLMPSLFRDFKEELSRKQDEEFPEFPQRHQRQPARPELRRDAVAPPPPLQPPPPAPAPESLDPATDSLSLAQLRKIVQDLPKAEQQPAYAFSYADCQPFPEELDEWFQYNESDRLLLLGSKDSFEQNWSHFTCSLPEGNGSEITWLNATEDLKKTYLGDTISTVSKGVDILARIEALQNICYLVTGVWGVTAGRATDDYPQEPTETEAAEMPKERSLQIQWIERNVDLFQQVNGLPILFSYLQRVFDSDKMAGDDVKVFNGENNTAAYFAARDREVNLILTIFYFLVEVARRQEKLRPDNPQLRECFAALNPSYLVVIAQIIAGLRWEDVTNFPLTRLIVLFWKSVLLLFGGSNDLHRAKTVLEPEYDEKQISSNSPLPVLTASPLDYHAFRQELTSKYPAYNPPPPLFPLELEHNSILPPFPNVSNRVNTPTLFSGTSVSSVSGNGSILHKSVHIATPAPSPPPSPGGPGKAGKKQNYQTNQNFPFMYPPLDSTSNNIGGKGSSVLQDVLVGHKWEGSDVPSSIIEAGKLFSSRMRMTRALKQLWDEREKFMKYDRGWDANETLRRSNEEASSSVERSPGEATPPAKQTEDKDVQRRLDAVESFYSQILPHLQSIVIVLLKEILTNITATAGHLNGNGQNGHKPGMMTNGTRESQVPSNDVSESLDDLDAVRCREIKSKAISGTLLLLLKWFKRSHVLQFEYMTQLLLDSNYLPLILKMFIHEDVDKAVAKRNDRDDLSFFHFCHIHSDQAPQPSASPEPERVEDSEEEAVPPPISRSRSSLSVLNISAAPSERSQDSQALAEGPYLPEVDELGFPTAPLPDAPITEFSFRNFFSAINYLHIMQKITRNKAHRCLLLVQYKSSAVLRKGIKIPNPHLRLYTLKLFKSQVPYCGRKWRQTHMRIITAIYLYCRPELRDDWLAGADIDAEVEDSLPMEQALRGLTHWWHLRRYKDAMAVEGGQAMMDEERDFFSRELENMGWGLVEEDGDVGAVEDGNVGSAMPGGAPNQLEGAPLQMES
ncbi:N1221-like family protein [Coccidioides posadasii C735 delta SOWgp]|uniref:N1221-like family protein n=2 Tax=Coccidioides posadasii TaxID=199306 RepID=C5NZS2_COCP7|nr:N1221-like family protein [Coccidioides posadasii C735 delta SOWgp]EER29965.1 N1221-like family protein [Coccidioides posadasii C735 delta SOWgp]|eukprot:XP_003072110.1 N1221-like family protein [Coccidioides posadasii C735 delta SOWgp]